MAWPQWVRRPGCTISTAPLETMVSTLPALLKLTVISWHLRLKLVPTARTLPVKTATWVVSSMCNSSEVMTVLPGAGVSPPTSTSISLRGVGVCAPSGSSTRRARKAGGRNDRMKLLGQGGRVGGGVSAGGIDQPFTLTGGDGGRR